MPVDQDTLADLALYDELFAKWEKKHPGQPFSKFSAARIAASLAKGTRHQALGSNLNFKGDWWEAGAGIVQEIRSAREISRVNRVCEYGCGSLRIGAHFIVSQETSRFFGVDVTDDFIRHGLKQVGPKLIAAKRPRLGSIKACMAELVAFNVDVLISTDVVAHVHPDELTEYFENIKQIVHQPGSSAVILAVTSDEPVRFQRSGWARPLETYVEGLAPLRQTHTTKRKSFVRNGVKLESVMTRFDRD